MVGKLIDFARTFLGVGWAMESPNIPGGDEDLNVAFCNDRQYTARDLSDRGVSCSAFINILWIHLLGLPARGEKMWGIVWWGNALRNREFFDQNKTYPSGTLLFRRRSIWTKSLEMRKGSTHGHLAMVTDHGRLIHSWPTYGVKEVPIREIHWHDKTLYPNGYFEFAVLPENWLKKSLAQDQWK